MRFVVIADTHVRPEGVEPGDFPANRLLAGRNRHAVEIIERLGPDLVIHLGDVVHPLPGDADHDVANDLAVAAYRRLSAPFHVVPGNHDVGDKPYPWVDAPTVAEEHYDGFIDRWGPRHRSFAMEGCRFVLVDTPVLNTGSEAEEEQWSWLGDTLAAAATSGERIFLFGHYPPYLWEPDEEEHYDNLGLPARARFLDLIRRFQVEAVFSGHVHRFFHRRHAETDLYVVPAIGFVRPGYSEFDAIAPNHGYGRDDVAKLGLFVVEVESKGHVIRPVRTWGKTDAEPSTEIFGAASPGWSLRLGVTMRHGWAAPRDLTMNGLDEFVRKRARDDAAVLALWEARISRVRVPVADLEHADTRERIAELAARGIRFTVLVQGWDRLESIPSVDGVERWEVVVAPTSRSGDTAARRPGGRLAVGPVVPLIGPEWVGGHFVAHGFSPTGADLLPFVGDADEAVFRVAPEISIWDAAVGAVETAASAGVRALLIVELSRLSEGRMYDEDATVAAQLLLNVAKMLCVRLLRKA